MPRQKTRITTRELENKVDNAISTDGLLKIAQGNWTNTTVIIKIINKSKALGADGTFISSLIGGLTKGLGKNPPVEIIVAAVKINPEVIGIIPRGDDYLLPALRANGLALEHLSNELKTPERCKVAVQNNSRAYLYVPENVKKGLNLKKTDYRNMLRLNDSGLIRKVFDDAGSASTEMRGKAVKEIFMLLKDGVDNVERIEALCDNIDINALKGKHGKKLLTLLVEKCDQVQEAPLLREDEQKVIGKVKDILSNANRQDLSQISCSQIKMMNVTSHKKGGFTYKSHSNPRTDGQRAIPIKIDVNTIQSILGKVDCTNDRSRGLSNKI